MLLYLWSNHLRSSAARKIWQKAYRRTWFEVTFLSMRLKIFFEKRLDIAPMFTAHLPEPFMITGISGFVCKILVGFFEGGDQGSRAERDDFFVVCLISEGQKNRHFQ